ncbi:MAG: hypothetical protein R3304_10115 [Longimicrobiales bacterium]|nr:hypothetical protein [Longimicrobiales bacterium]
MRKKLEALGGRGSSLAAGVILLAGLLAMDARRDPTFADDVAPILARECVACHNPSGWAPFSLTSYEAVRRRGERIVEATSSGHMPPWLPEAAPGTFQGERRLTPGEVELLRRWVEAGYPPGDLSGVDLSSVDPGWDPGAPDLVVELPTYHLPAEGGDRYRNLVVPIPVQETRWVEYVELVPGSRTAVHHARMMVDTTTTSAELAARDPEPGFDGMELLSQATNPDGHFVGWTPGKTRLKPPEGMAWRLDPGTDLVVQLHLRTSGQAEDVSARVELHFADEPPTRHPAILVISSLMIDIPPGATDYTVVNSFTLPVDVDVLSIYPHAHFLGKELRATAILPDGRERVLIHIPDWDFNWQDDYRFTRPVSLPAGTRIVKEYSYDNSARNPSNPSDPPRRVVYGSNSDDEMADLILQVLPENERDREALLQAQAWQHETEDMAYLAWDEYRKGRAAMEAGELDTAVRHFRAALQYRADHVGALVGLARIFGERGDWSSSLMIARQAELMSSGEDPRALDVLSRAQAEMGETDEALDTARRGLSLARSRGEAELAAVLEGRIARLRRR